jgi:uncharacterized protein (DUF934 family)
VTSSDTTESSTIKWQLVTVDEKPQPNAKYLILPLATWLAEKTEYQARNDIAIWLESAEEPEQVADDLTHFAFVALNFPTFRDGRGYSSASILRRQLGYKGELRAIGDIRPDQFEQLIRCGFDKLCLADGSEVTASDVPQFSYHYQAAADNSEPLFRTEKLD